MSSIPKKRADELVHAAGLAESRNKAQALIISSQIEYQVTSGQWKLVDKPGQQISENALFRIRGDLDLDVGRGAKKLRPLFSTWPELREKVRECRALDIGSSTGGFTQVLLEMGAKNVVCVDVGTHQLHERLRADPRVQVFEKTHVLEIDSSFWKNHNVVVPFNFYVTDLSFISVNKVLSHARDWLAPGGYWLILVKPQFELSARLVPKGIVHKEEDRQLALQKVIDCVAMIGGLDVRGVVDCPITGTKGNKEFFLWLERKL